ncbi:MAG: SpoIID/LytB domain-containing protein, partial [Candidatus Gastranaerophilaceae bacterium]
MGNKINTIFLACFILFLFIVAGFNTAMAKCDTVPKSPIIRVGIMDNGFKTLERSSVTLFGTDTCYVCEPDTRKTICKVKESEPVSFIINNGVITCKYDCSSFVSENGFVVACPKGVIGVKELKRAGKQAMYRGAFKIQKSTKPNVLYLINIIELEDYLKGVVSNEMPVTFGLEALKAQAVAARNYALTPRTKVSKAYDVVDSVASQVYFGYNTETETGDRAVKETEGIIAMYNHHPILALYSSCAGGYTENYSYAFSDPDTKQFPSPLKPYLISKPDIQGTPALNREDAAYKFYSTTPESYDMKSRYYRWTKEWDREELEQV